MKTTLLCISAAVTLLITSCGPQGGCRKCVTSSMHVEYEFCPIDDNTTQITGYLNGQVIVEEEFEGTVDQGVAAYDAMGGSSGWSCD